MTKQEIEDFEIEYLDFLCPEGTCSVCDQKRRYVKSKLMEYLGKTVPYTMAQELAHGEYIDKDGKPIRAGFKTIVERYGFELEELPAFEDKLNN